MTTDHNDDSAAFRAVLIGDALERAGEHPDLDTLADYAADRLDREEEEHVRDHLAACKDCCTVVLDLEPLANPEEGPEGVADLGLEIAWKDMKSRIGVLESASRPARFTGWPAAMAATLLVGVVGLSVWVTELQRSTTELRHQVAELSRPQVNPPIIYLDGISRGEPTVSVAELASDQPFILLIVVPGSAGTFTSFEALLTDSAGEVVWSGTDLSLSEAGTLRLRMPKELVPAGNYRVQVQGHGGGQADGAGENLVDTSLQILYK